MTYLLPYPLPFLFTGVFHWHLGVDREGTAITASKSRSLLSEYFVVDIKTITGRTEQGADAATDALGSYLFPVFFILKAG